MTVAIRLQDVHKRYRVYHRRNQSLKDVVLQRRLGSWEDRWALQGVSLEVPAGKTFGLIGSNGAGKSTMLKLMARVLTPDRGTVWTSGRMGSLIELGAGFHPDSTGRENVYLNASLLGLSRREIRRRFDAIVEFAELGERIDAPLRTYSSGMVVRLGFAVAAHVDAEVLLLDEILAVGDESFQRRCLDHIKSFREAGGTIVYVSHSMDSVRALCQEVAWIENGQVCAFGPSAAVVQMYIDQVSSTWEAGRAQAMSQSPDVEITAVVLRCNGDGMTEVVRTGQQLTVEVRYRIRSRVECPVFGVAVHRSDGLYVYGTNTQVDGILPDHLLDEGAVSLRFPNLALASGTYRVTAAVFGQHSTVPLDFHDQRYTFRVETEDESHGAVRLEHDWDFSAAVPASSGVSS